MNNMSRRFILNIILLVVILGAGWFVCDKFFIQEENKMDEDTLTANQTATSTEDIATPTTSTQNNQNKKMENHIVILKTNFGEIQIQTYDSDAPKTTDNFIKLVQEGFYNNLIFHRIIKGFMIQGGDPFCGASKDKGFCGAGDPGYTFKDELNPNTASYKNGYQKGVVAMANSGPDTNGSQFFIMLENSALPHDYTIFGKVIKGQDIVDIIGNVKTDGNDRPITPIIIQSATVKAL